MIAPLLLRCRKKKKKKSKAEEIESLATSTEAEQQQLETKKDKEQDEIDTRTPAEIAFEKAQEKRVKMVFHPWFWLDLLSALPHNTSRL